MYSPVLLFEVVPDYMFELIVLFYILTLFVEESQNMKPLQNADCFQMIIYIIYIL